MQAEEEADISDGEIIDDDNEECETKKSIPQIRFPTEKPQKKNFRKSNQNEDSDCNDDNDSCERKSANKPVHRTIKHAAKKRKFGREPIEHRHRHFNERLDHRNRPNFKHQSSSLRKKHEIMRNKIPKTLKYTVTMPSISYAENPRIDSEKLTRLLQAKPKRSPIQTIVYETPKEEETTKQNSGIEKQSFTPSPKDETGILENISQTCQKELDNSKDSIPKIPEVIESPPRSPPETSTSDLTSNSLFQEKSHRNVCSFLSDIESEGYLSLSSFSLLNDFDDEESDVEHNNNSTNIDDAKTSVVLSSTIDESQSKNLKIQDSDEDTSNSSSSSSEATSDSSSTSSEESEDESSELSSNDDVTPFSTGFGRFSSTDSSIPFSIPFSSKGTEIQVKPFESTITKPPLFTAASCIRPSQLALKTGGMITPNFAVPFKIYSIRDFSTSQPFIPFTPQVQASPKELKVTEKEVRSDKDYGSKDEKRARRSRSRSLERRRSVERDKDRNKKIERKRSPLKRRSTSPVNKRKSPQPSSHKRKPHSRHSSPSPSLRSRQRNVSHTAISNSARKPLQRPRSKERARKRSHSPQQDRSVQPKYKSYKEERISSYRRDEEILSPYVHEQHSSLVEGELGMSDEDSQTYLRRHLTKDNKLDSSEILHPSNDDSNYDSSSFYYPQCYRDNYQEDYFMPLDQYYDEFYSNSKSFINNFNLVDITQQRRDRQRAESSLREIAVQVGNVLEIVPNAEIIENTVEAKSDINPKELKEKRKLYREKKRMMKKKRKELLRKEIQNYFDEGINIEDSEEESVFVERSKIIEETPKGIIKSSNSEKQNNRRVIFGDGFYPFESSDHEEIILREEPNRKINRKRKIKEGSKAFKEAEQNKLKTVAKQHADYYENVPPPPPSGQPTSCMQPELRVIPPDLYEKLPISLNPIYYYCQKMHYQNNGHHNAKGSLTVRNPNTSDPRLSMGSNTNCYNRF